MEDWNNLFEHALISDASPDFQQWLHHRSGWQWQPPPEQADHPEEALVGGLSQSCTSLAAATQTCAELNREPQAHSFKLKLELSCRCDSFNSDSISGACHSLVAVVMRGDGHTKA